MLAGVFCAGGFCAAAGLLAAGFAAGVSAGAGFDAPGAFAVEAFSAGAFFTGVGFFAAGLAGAESPSSGFFEAPPACGIGFFVPIGVRFTGALLLVVEGVGFVAGFAESPLAAAGAFLAAGAFFAGADSDDCFASDAGFAGEDFAAGFEGVPDLAAGFAGDDLATGFLTASATCAAGSFDAAFLRSGMALPVVLLTVEFTVSLYPCALSSRPSPVSVIVLPYCRA